VEFEKDRHTAVLAAAVFLLKTCNKTGTEYQTRYTDLIKFWL